MKKLLFLLTSLFVGVGAIAQNICHIEGAVIDRPDSQMLWLSPFNSDSRVVDPIEIAISEDGTFSYSLEYDKTRLYTLVFADERQKGAWRPINFMLENGTVKFELYPMEKFYDTKISGGKLNDQLFYLNFGIQAEYNARLEELNIQFRDAGDELQTAEYRACIDSLSISDISRDQQTKLYRRLEQLSAQGKMYNQKGNELSQQWKDISGAIDTKKLDVIRKNPNEASLAVLHTYIVFKGTSNNSPKYF
ncbi:MAG: DUF4369 domain-containing protein [Rikenellaceae bacterium]